jgi:hypothetical protein
MEKRVLEEARDSKSACPVARLESFFRADRSLIQMLPRTAIPLLHWIGK